MFETMRNVWGNWWKPLVQYKTNQQHPSASIYPKQRPRTEHWRERMKERVYFIRFPILYNYVFIHALCNKVTLFKKYEFTPLQKIFLNWIFTWTCVTNASKRIVTNFCKRLNVMLRLGCNNLGKVINFFFGICFSSKQTYLHLLYKCIWIHHYT